MDKKLTAIIVDDETLAREIIKKYLGKYSQIDLLAECSNGFEGFKQINELKPDILFLDVQMPKLTGFEMLEILDNIPSVIFTTAYDQYAIKAFEVNAVDYLLKPYSEARFDEAITKLLIKLSAKQNEPIQNIQENFPLLPEYIERIVIKDGQKIFIVPVNDVIYIEAQDDYVMIYTPESKYLKQKRMKYYEDKLNPDSFIRIHRSYIVKIDYIKRLELFEKETYRVILKNEKVLPVSKSGYSKLKDILNN